MRFSRFPAVLAALSLGLGLVACAAAQDDSNPRFGVWRLRSDNPPPYQNVMTYAPHGEGGMSITVATTNAEGNESVWGYSTMFDGAFRPVEGLENSETAVEVVDEQSTRISNMRNGTVYQVIINTLSDDGNRIDNEYVRMDADGQISRVTHAIYDRVQEE